jgi:ubiquinone/menaquinone biosynthesis C-methylase UbiE
MTIDVTHDPVARLRAQDAGEQVTPRTYDSSTNADVTWEGPEYKKLQPIVFGYAMFETLFAACELDMFTKLSENPGMTLDELSRELDLPPHPTRLLALACASTELVVKNGDRYYNSYVSEKLLVRGKPKCAIPFVRSGQFLQYKGFYHLLDALREETNVGLQEYRQGHLYDSLTPNRELEGVLYDVMAAIWELSHRGLDEIAEFKQVKHLLDVAGGNAVVASHLHDKYPHLRISVFDRPTACERGRATIANNGKQASIDTVAGDMLEDPYPSGPDAISYCHILSALPAADRDTLMHKAYAALPSGGRLFAYDFTCNDDETGELYGARLSLYFVVAATGAGMAYPSKDYARWLQDAGFRDVKVYKELPFEHAVIVGAKP